MRTLIISNNGTKAVKSLCDILAEYCAHTFTNGSADLVNPEMKDKKSIIRELGTVSRILIDIKGGTNIRIPDYIVPQILSFMGWSKMYDPEAALLLTNMYIMYADE